MLVFPLLERQETHEKILRTCQHPTYPQGHARIVFKGDKTPEPSLFSNGSRTELHACSHTQAKQHQVREQPSCNPRLHFLASVPCTNHRCPATRPLAHWPCGFPQSVPSWYHVSWCYLRGATAYRETASRWSTTIQRTNPALCHGDALLGWFAETMLTFQRVRCSRA